MHLSKPHWDGQYLVIQAVNCTAGLFGGDRIDVGIEARRGSRALITSPSAQRAYPARTEGSRALIEQSFTVESGAWLEVCPEIFIPHFGSRVRQNTRLDVQSGGELFYLESLAPGRVGSGESFAYAQLEWMTELRIDAELIARERYTLSANGESVARLRAHFPEAYYASGYVVSPQLAGNPQFRQNVAALATADAHIAASFPVPNVATIKILAGGSMALRACLQRLRETVYANLERPLPNWRKL